MAAAAAASGDAQIGTLIASFAPLTGRLRVLKDTGADDHKVDGPCWFMDMFAEKQTDVLLRAWRGETVQTQVAVWSGSWPVTACVKSATVAAEWVQLKFVGLVLGDDGVWFGDALLHEQPDRKGVPSSLPQLIWVTVQVPRGTAPGNHSVDVNVSDPHGKHVSVTVKVEVAAQALPEPSAWKFRLDLWQNPYSVAAYHGVPAWSAEHWTLLGPHLRMLAGCGQKCITTTIVHQPWGTQTYTPYDSMVTWIQPDSDTASLRFDFSIFDAYVQFCMQQGISDTISCYSILPWADSGSGSEAKVSAPRNYPVWSEASRGWIHVSAATLDDNYKWLWGACLKALQDHLEERGWLSRAQVAIDERPPEEVMVWGGVVAGLWCFLHITACGWWVGVWQQVVGFMREVAPKLRVALAGLFHEELGEVIDDWSLYMRKPFPSTDLIGERRARGQHTTFYVCCGPAAPNSFVGSAMEASMWLPMFGHAMGYDGMLRWAYDCWTQQPLSDARHGAWPAGDCYLVYPHAQSSIRLELLRAGIQLTEKCRLVAVPAEVLMPILAQVAEAPQSRGGAASDPSPIAEALIAIHNKIV